jgi:Putative Actinobacterial Holin-X, holin superfamily III
MSEPTTRDGREGDAARSAGERLAGDMADVVREEVHAVRTDLADAARPATAGLLMMGAAAGCAVLGIGAASATALRVLETFLPRRLAAAGMTAGYFAGAAVLAGMGLQRLQAAGGTSQRLADRIRDAITQTVGRPGQAGVTAARAATTG